MGEAKNVFQKDCECRYIPGMDIEANYVDKLRNVSTDFIDRVLMTNEVSKTDFFYLRAVTFYRIATAEMVAEYIRYFCSYYGASECTNLLQPNVSSRTVNPLVREEDYRRDAAEIRNRLNRLAKKHLLFSYTVNSEEVTKGYAGMVFCANYTTFSLVKTFFGETPCFGDEGIGYERYYCITPVQRMMESLHACRVGILGFMYHTPRARLLREKEIIYGAQKSRYIPTMIAELKSQGYNYKIIIEPIHFTVDERILTKTEHRQNIETLIATIGKLINHYNYMEKNFQTKPIKERIRFLIAVENLEGMKQVVQLMNPYREKYSGKVFFTTDAALLETESLMKSVLMAKEVPSKISGDLHLGLVRPNEESLTVTHNEWILNN